MEAGVPAGMAQHLWVSRLGSTRHLWNEREVEAILMGLGWTVAAPGEMKLRDQIALFKGARHIAGVTGAGLTNLVFAASGTAVTSFMPANMSDTFFWLLAQLRRQHLTEVRCPQGLVSGIAKWDTALVLSLPEVLARLVCYGSR